MFPTQPKQGAEKKLSGRLNPSAHWACVAWTLLASAFGRSLLSPSRLKSPPPFTQFAGSNVLGLHAPDLFAVRKGGSLSNGDQCAPLWADQIPFHCQLPSRAAST